MSADVRESAAIKEVIAACERVPQFKQLVEQLRTAGYSVTDIAGVLNMSAAHRHKIRLMLQRMQREGIRSGSPVPTDARYRQSRSPTGERVREIELALCKPIGGWLD
jgi:hypothetical protein